MSAAPLPMGGFRETVDAGSQSTVLVGADNYSRIPPRTSVAVTPHGGSARIEKSLSHRNDVLAGTATWHTWQSGSVTSSAHDALAGPVTALRLVVVTGSATWEVLA